MNDSKLVQIADILPPTAPVPPSVDLLLVFFLLIAVVAVIAVIGFWYRRSSKQQLKRLRKQCQHRKIDNRRCAFQLSNLLRKKRPLHQNSQRHDASATLLSAQHNNDAWQEYSTTLQVACFSRRSLDDDAMSKLLQETERWL